MKFVYPEISNVINTVADRVNTFVIENKQLFYRLVTDVYEQTEGFEGRAVVSQDNKILPFSKWVELHSCFVPFDLNRKTLLSKAASQLEKLAVSDDYYAQSIEILGTLESHLLGITSLMSGNLAFTKLNIGAIIKSVGLTFEEDDSTLCEKIIDYMELVREYDQDKLFIFVNLRSYICDEECEAFFETVLGHGFNILLIDNCESPVLINEKRCIIDSDLCEIV